MWIIDLQRLYTIDKLIVIGRGIPIIYMMLSNGIDD